MLVDMQLSAFSCESQVAPVILAENAGTDTIYSFEISYEVGSNTALETWTGVLPPRERVSVSLPPMVAPTGEQDVLVMVGQPNGVEDERPRNNNFRRRAIVADREPFSAYAQGGTSVCAGTSALLFGDSPYPDGELEVSWFDDPNGTEPVFTGVPFLTPTLTAPTSYFAEAKYVLGVGPKDATIGVPKYRTPGDFQFGMRFEVKAPLTLKSVTVEAEVTGGRALVLEDADGESIKSKVAILSEVGQNEVPLNWALEPGNYTLYCTLGNPLMCNNSGAEYPYELDEFFSLRGTSTGGVNDDNLYYFYDWKIEITEPCGRTPVLVEVGPAGDAPVASFSPSIDVFNIDENIPVQFENTSELGESFLWNFDDGTTSEEASPEHTFTAPGTYTVSLMVTSADGCTDAAVHTIVVEESLISSADEVGGLESMDKVTVFPNPVREMLTVYVELASVQPVTLRLNDLSGRSVRTEKFAKMQAGQLQLDVADLPEGVYFLMVETGAGRTAWKIVKT
jgi:PKD repeat protein